MSYCGVAVRPELLGLIPGYPGIEVASLQTSNVSTSKVSEPDGALPQGRSRSSKYEEGALGGGDSERSQGFTEDRREACAKAQRCGKVELGIWESTGVRGDTRAGVGGG